MNTLRRAPLQPSGWFVLGLTVVSLVAGLVLDWDELLVLALGCGLALLLAVPFVVGRSSLTLTRELRPERVHVGTASTVELTAHNTGPTPVAPRRVQDFIDGARITVDLPALAGDASATRSWTSPNERRGKKAIGPARVTKGDPFGLMRRDVGQTPQDTLWVLPRIVRTPAFAAGVLKDVDGPTYDTSPAGDAVFHTVRPYRVGDDVRHVHWMATARANEMMVRQYVDNRQSHMTIVLDCGADAYATDDDFETAVSIASSLAVGAHEGSRKVTVLAGDQQIASRRKPTSLESLLNAMAVVETRPDFDLPVRLPILANGERDTNVLVAVSGAREPDEVSAMVARLPSTDAVLFITVEADLGGDVVGSRTFGRTTHLRVGSLDDFAAMSVGAATP